VPTTLLIARHGETDWNRERRWQGHADPPLNELGREQARGLAARPGSDPPDAIYSSDLARACETAEIVGARLGVDVRLDERLREVDVGEWSGLTTSEIERLYPEGLRKRRAGGTGWKRGESYAAMGARVVEALHDIATATPDGRVLVVTHGGPMCSVWLGAGGDLAAWQRSANCDVDEIAIEDGQIRWIDSARVGGLHQQVQG
jgi:broad specificity phosphatase PhoE